jgi:hypothetical protein
VEVSEALRAQALADFREVVHRLGKVNGVQIADVDHEKLELKFTDAERLVSRGVLEVFFKDRYYIWCLLIDQPHLWTSGPLGRGRWIAVSPWARQVVRLYLHEADRQRRWNHVHVKGRRRTR